MKQLLQRLLRKPIIRLANKFSSRPDKARVFDALTNLHADIRNNKAKKGLCIPFEPLHDRFIILSDQHKGCKNHADDFLLCENNYIAALDYYFKEGFTYINLGDSEELWENTFVAVKKFNELSFEKEKQFLREKRFVKIFGNHDLQWENDPFAPGQLKEIYGQNIFVYEGCILETEINNRQFQVYLTHGHQGDRQSDGNAVSKFFVARIWAPLQAYLNVNPNTPATNNHLKTIHNSMMYEWSSEHKNMLLITGHTHQPVFMSLTHLERLYVKLAKAKQENDEKTLQQIAQEMSREFIEGEIKTDFNIVTPSYFNSGCCCFSDGDITGIEIAGGDIRLIKWQNKNSPPERVLLEKISLAELEKLLP